MEKREKIIYDAVINNITVGGKFGGSIYNVCDLMNLSRTTLDAIYVNISKNLNSLNAGSLISKNKSYLELEAQKDLVEAVFSIVTERQREIENKQKELEKRRRKLHLLKEAKNIKEVEDISKLSLEDLEKQIEELE